MQIIPAKSASALYGSNQDRAQSKAERTTPNPNPSKTDKALTVAISTEARALLREAARAHETRQDLQQQAQQALQAQRPAGKATQRIDIAV